METEAPKQKSIDSLHTVENISGIKCCVLLSSTFHHCPLAQSCFYLIGDVCASLKCHKIYSKLSGIYHRTSVVSLEHRVVSQQLRPYERVLRRHLSR